METDDDWVDREAYVSLGTERGTDRRFLSVAIAAQVVDYEVHERLTEEEYRRFLVDRPAALARADQVRIAEHERRRRRLED